MPVTLNKLQIVNIKIFIRINKWSISYKKQKTSYFDVGTNVQGSER